MGFGVDVVAVVVDVAAVAVVVTVVDGGVIVVGFAWLRFVALEVRIWVRVPFTPAIWSFVAPETAERSTDRPTDHAAGWTAPLSAFAAPPFSPARVRGRGGARGHSWIGWVSGKHYDL